MKLIAYLALMLVGSSGAWALDKSEMAQKLIEKSIREYRGNCPCPYNIDRAGRKCGKRSAYSKPGGHSPLCYEEDVTNEMIEAYLRER